MFDFDTLRPHSMVEPEGLITRRKDLRALAFSTSVRKLLTDAPLLLAPETSLSRAAAALRAHDTTAALVICSDSLLGVITSADLAATSADPHHTSVWQAMTPEPPFCLSTDSVASALRLFKTYAVAQLPVMQPDGPVIGILTPAHIINWLSDHLTVVALD